MGCYIVPSIVAIMHFLMMKNISSLKKDKRQKWLNNMLIGGAIFGIVDHIWNGEIFLFGENLFLDLMLGVTITTIILLVWEIMVIYDKHTIKNTHKIIN